MAEGIEAYIRREVIPEDMTITEAAQRLGVARSTLSKLLNGKSSLSERMAKKLEHTFEIDAKLLLERQNSSMPVVSAPSAALDTAGARIGQRFRIRASDITRLFETPQSRPKLPVFLRTLIRSTSSKRLKCNFPGDEDGERPGWDGFTVADVDTEWVPDGRAGWEISTEKNVSKKANEDYRKRSTSSDDDKQETTYVFVTTQRWQTKNKWMQKAKREANWKDVQVYDNSDLVQWVECSAAARAWLLNEMGYRNTEITPISVFWQRWSDCCNPPMSRKIFADSCSLQTAENLAKKLDERHPVYIEANSSDEGIAYLDVLFDQEPEELQSYRDCMIVVNDEDFLQEILRIKSGTIPIIRVQNLNRMLGTSFEGYPSIFITAKGMSVSNVDVTLDVTSRKTFYSAMREAGFKLDDIERLQRESGRSITVLRRRLSTSEIIKHPIWSRDDANKLIPICFAGMWEIDLESDKEVLRMIGQQDKYSQIEKDVLELCDQEDSPVWMINNINGVVSQVDSLFSIHGRVTRSFLMNYFDVIFRVLAEDDTSLILPTNRRYVLSLYGKRKKISDTLRRGLANMLIVLSVYGRCIFKNKLWLEIEHQMAQAVYNILSPLTFDKLGDQTTELAAYAEAAPKVVLDIFWKDIEGKDSAITKVLRNGSTAFIGNFPRVGVLRALESLAWRQQYFAQSVDILTTLASIDITGNIVQRPRRSLKAIFHPIYPATRADLRTRRNVLQLIARKCPDTCWSICWCILDENNIDLTSHYRPVMSEGFERKPNNEIIEMKTVARKLIEGREHHTVNSLCDFLHKTVTLEDESFVDAIMQATEHWNNSASDKERSHLRDRLCDLNETWKRYKVSKNRKWNLSLLNKMMSTSDKMFEIVEPKRAIFIHSWLFRKEWYNETMEDSSFEAKKNSKRVKAIESIWKQEGMGGLVEFTEICSDKHKISYIIFKYLKSNKMKNKFVLSLIKLRNIFDSNEYLELLETYLFETWKMGKLGMLVEEIKGNLSRVQFMQFLQEIPIFLVISRYLEDEDISLVNHYWANCRDSAVCENKGEMLIVIEKLLVIGRARFAIRLTAGVKHEIQIGVAYRLLHDETIVMEVEEMCQVDQFTICDLIQKMRSSEQMSIQDIAELEFMYIDLVGMSGGSIECLERVICDNPQQFAQVVTIFHRPDNQGEDKHGRDKKELMRQMSNTRKAGELLSKIQRIPGENDEGVVCAISLIKWIEEVRKNLNGEHLMDMGEWEIGELLAKSAIGKDGVWPCEGVRKALEETHTESMGRGFVTGKYNMREAMEVTHGGAEHHNYAKQFMEWATKLDGEFWRVAKMLREIAEDNEREGIDWDSQSEVKKRIM